MINNNLRLSTLFYILVMSYFSLQASQISIEEAIQKAKVFDNELSASAAQIRSVSILSEEKTYTLARHQKTSDGKNSCYYIFNRSNNNGFVIVSAENSTSNSVLGYTDSGSFEAENMSEGMSALLDNYQSQIEYLITHPQKSSIQSQKENEVIDKEVPALLGNNQWCQYAPFNNFCPMDGEKRSIAGCSALAIAQIMYYNKWPDHGQGSITYTTETLQKELSVDFENTYYDYESMLPSYLYSDYSQASADAVATLVYHAGVACQTEYSNISSGAYVSKIIKPLYKYFKYDKSISILNSTYYSKSEWEEIIKQELDCSRPLLYALFNYNSFIGHFCVCDGYDKNGYFHFNWGWNGINNGYYLLNAMNSYPEPLNYDHSMIMGIKKAEENSKRKVELYHNGCSASYTRNQLSITFKNVMNNTWSSDSLDLGLIMEDSLGNKIKDFFLIENDHIKYFYFKNIRFSLSSTNSFSDIKDGIYYLYLGAAIPKEGDTLTKAHGKRLSTNTLMVSIENNKLKNYSVNVDTATLHIIEYQEACPLYIGAPVLINTEIRNTGTENYYDSLYFTYSNLDGTVNGKSLPTMVYIEENKSERIKFYVTFSAQDSIKEATDVTLYLRSYNDAVLDSIHTKILPATKLPDITCISYPIMDFTCDSLFWTTTVVNTGGPYYGTIDIETRNQKGTLLEDWIVYADIKEYDTTQLVFHFSLENLFPDSTYNSAIYYNAYASFINNSKFSYTIPSPTTINNIPPNHDFTIYPVPAKDRLNIDCENEIESVKIVSLHGITLFAKPYKATNTACINVENLNSGFYFIVVKTKDRKEEIRLFNKQ